MPDLNFTASLVLHENPELLATASISEDVTMSFPE